MDNQAPVQFSNPLHVPTTINSLPLEIVSMIAEYLAIEPDVTKRDQTVQRRKNLYRLCRASIKLYQGAIPVLYETIYIPNTLRLGRLLHTFENHRRPEKRQHVRKLFVNLRMCFGGISEHGSPEVCDQLYRLLNKTVDLKLLSLDLRECDHFMCYPTISPASFAANGANGKKLSMNCMSFTTWPLSRSCRFGVYLIFQCGSGLPHNKDYLLTRSQSAMTTSTNK